MSAAVRRRRPADAGEAARVLGEESRPPVLTGSTPADLPAAVRRAIRGGERAVLSTEAISGIEAYRPEDLTVTARAGTRAGTLQERLREEGQWIPVSRAGLRRSVGGLVASAPPTPYAGEYGPLRRQVLAVRVVTYDGDRLDWGRPVVKDVAGYDVPRLACGSRARLGLLARVTLRVWPLPAARRRFEVRPGSGGGGAGATVGVRAGEDWRPDAETWTWTEDGEGDPPLLVELAGSEASVDAREERLRRWTEGRDLELRRRPPGASRPGPPPPGRGGGADRPTPRPAALRFRVDPRYVGRAAAALRESDGVCRVAAHPREGVVTASLPAGEEGAGALEAVDGAAPEAGVQVDRGRARLHERAAARRNPDRVEVERRVLEALGGRRRPWTADFL